MHVHVELISSMKLHCMPGATTKGVRDCATSEERASPLTTWAATVANWTRILQGWKRTLSCRHEGNMQSRCSLFSKKA